MEWEGVKKSLSGQLSAVKNLKYKNKRIASIFNRSDSQPGCRGTQGCREEVSGVPPNV